MIDSITKNTNVISSNRLKIAMVIKQFGKTYCSPEMLLILTAVLHLHVVNACSHIREVELLGNH